MRNNIMDKFGMMKKINMSSNIINKIIIINVIVFLFANMLVSYATYSGGDILESIKHLVMSSDYMRVLYTPWTLITSMFTHIDFMHILFNMLYFYMFGKILQESYGGQSVLSAYILGGLLGGVFYMVFLPLFSNQESYALGASGGVTAIMVAAAVINPNRYLNLFIIGQVKIKWVVLVLFLLSSVINFHENTGGKIDHFGGAIFGYIYAYFLVRGINIASWFDNLMSFKFKKSNKKILQENNYGFRGSMDRRTEGERLTTHKNFVSKKEATKEIDKLLDKIHKKGYKSLSEEEKENLKQLSEKM